MKETPKAPFGPSALMLHAKARFNAGILILSSSFPAGWNRNPEERRKRYVASAARYLHQRDFVRAALELKNALRVVPNDAS